MTELIPTRRLVPALIALLLALLGCWALELGTSSDGHAALVLTGTGVGRAGIPAHTDAAAPQLAPTGSYSDPGSGVASLALPAGARDEGPQTKKQLGVTVGAVSGLYPGRTLRVPVTYSNPNAFDIVVNHVLVNTTGAAGCYPSQFRTGAPAARLNILPHQAVTSFVKLGMRRTAPDACKGVEVGVHVVALAVKK